jgi:hypothetical protein
MHGMEARFMGVARKIQCSEFRGSMIEHIG